MTAPIPISRFQINNAEYMASMGTLEDKLRHAGIAGIPSAARADPIKSDGVASSGCAGSDNK